MSSEPDMQSALRLMRLTAAYLGAAAALIYGPAIAARLGVAIDGAFVRYWLNTTAIPVALIALAATLLHFRYMR